MPWLKMRDFWTFRPSEIEPGKNHLFECKDAQSETGSSLLVHASATHSGVINGNMKMYRPDRMQAAVSTWLPKNSYARPVLVQHDEEGEIVGRIRSAEYVDESWKWNKDFPIVKDMAFYNKDARSKLSVLKSCDWIAKHLMPLEDFTGLGYIDLGFQVTDPKSIRKVLNDEYLTVSVGSRTDSAVCSICHTDWAADEPCEHKPGKMYDKQRCFLITGNLKYDEMSFVNFPADRAALITSKVLKDSLDRMFFLGLPVNTQDQMRNEGLQLTDSLYTSDLALVYEDAMTIDLNQVENLDKMQQDLDSPELNKDQALEIKGQLGEWAPDSEEHKARKRSLVATVNAHIRHKKWDPKVTTDSDPELDILVADAKGQKNAPKSFFMCSACNGPAAKCTCSDKDACKCKGCGKSADKCTCKEEYKEKAKDGCEDGVCDWETVTLTDAETEYFADVDGLYEELCVELDAAVTAGELTEVVIKDAKLSSEKRKDLGKDTFCGPNRSFPVPDCAHVTAARRLVGRAQVSQETKDKILACVDAKAKTLKCGVPASKDAATTTESADTAEKKCYRCQATTDLMTDGTNTICQDCLQDLCENDMTPVSDAIQNLGTEFLLKDAEGKEVEPTPEAKSVLGHYDSLHKIYGAADKDHDLRWRMRSLHDAVGNHWGTLDGVNWAREAVGRHCKDSQVILTSDLVSKETALNDLMVEKDSLVQRVDAANQKANIVLQDSKRSLATTIVVHKALKGVDGFKGLTAEQAVAKIEDLCKRHITSLRDTVNDILSDLQWVPVTDTSDDAAAELDVKVNDNAQIDTATAVKNLDAQQLSTQDQTRQDLDLISRKLSYMDPAARAIFLAEQRWGKAAK